METRSEFQQGGNASVHTDTAFIGPGKSGYQAQQGTFARPVGSYNRQALTLLHGEGDVFQSEEALSMIPFNPVRNAVPQKHAARVPGKRFGDAAKIDKRHRLFYKQS